MTLAQRKDLAWTHDVGTPRDHPAVADFLATTNGLGGRKFSADSRDVAEQFESALPGAVTVVRDDSDRVRGYAAVHRPHGAEVIADFVFDPATPPRLVDEVVDAAVHRFRREAAPAAGTFLRVFIGDTQRQAIDALLRQGAYREAQFIRTRKPLDEESPALLEAAAIEGLEVLGWPEVIERGLSEQVRRLQFDTFAEHFGNMSKTPEAWQHHLHSRSFAPDFSVAAVDQSGEVVGYVLGSVYTAGAAPGEERSAHTDYIGVRRDHRRRGIAELLLRKIWLAALRRGLTVASLGTDINNSSKAHELYARLGYVAVEHDSAYRIDG